jgi:hypothetical protein
MYNLKLNYVTNYLYNSLIELVVLKPKSAYNTSNDYQSAIEEWAMFCPPSTTQISALQLCTRIDDLTPYFHAHNNSQSRITNRDFRVVGANVLEEPCLVICLQSALASVRMDNWQPSGGLLSNERAEALRDFRSAFAKILKAFTTHCVTVNDRRLLDLWYTGMQHLQRSSYRFSRDYSVVKVFHNELCADSARASIARITSRDMQDQLQTAFKQLITPEYLNF